MSITPDMIERMQAAIEGELDGLAITAADAEAILQYVLTSAAPPAEPHIPAGWRLVPCEPTREMLAAADAADREYTDRQFGREIPTLPVGGFDHWCAMLEAAPEPPKEA